MTSDSKLHDAMAYICSRYEFPEDLSKARLTKLIYLADWRMALTEERQITPIKWVFNHYGPYVRDVEALAKSSTDFDVEATMNAYGSFKEQIRCHETASWESLGASELMALDFAMEKTWHLNFTEFIDVVYGTYPVKQSVRYDQMDLVSLAKQYRERGDAG